MNETRLKEFEALRGLSIVLLLWLHAHVFGLSVFGLFELDASALYVGAFLLGSFFFLAGYFFDMSMNKHSERILEFARSRILRVFPPYWMGLWLFSLIYTLRKRDLLVYALNLQIVFSPVFVKQLLTLWYISLLVVFYVIFGVLIWRMKSNGRLFISSVSVFLIIYVLHLTTDLFDPRFFMYFFVFLAGVYFFRFEGLRLKLLDLSFHYKLFLAAVGVMAYWLVQAGGLQTRNWLFIIGADVFVLTWVLLSLSIFRTGIGQWKVWAFLSIASYFAYLLHRPVWHALEGIMDIDAWGGIVAFQALPASAVTLILSYFMQLGYDRFLAFLRLK